MYDNTYACYILSLSMLKNECIFTLIFHKGILMYVWHMYILHRLERIVAVLLSTIRGTPAWNSSASTLHVIKGVIAAMADNLNAQAGALINTTISCIAHCECYRFIHFFMLFSFL